MRELFAPLTPPDYSFLVGLLESPFNLTDDAKLKALVAELEADTDGSVRRRLDAQLEREIRYVGSSELGYWGRAALGQDPGVSFQEILRDTAKTLKVEPPSHLGTLSDQLREMVETYVTAQFAHLKPEEQQRLLEDLGVAREEAAAFIKRSAGVFALPLLIQAFSAVIVEGLIKRIIFGTIAKLVGQQLSQRLFTFLAGRMPWWVGWVGPVAWSLSLGWTALDLQGPARRKTIPIVLYLGLCQRRGPAPDA